MNKILIVDASESDCRLTNSLLTRAGYEPIIAEDMEVAHQEVAKMSPGAVVITGTELAHENYIRLCLPRDEIEMSYPFHYLSK